MSVTLKDVAKKAGVSIATASRIINNVTSDRKGSKNSENVWKAVNELGYIPNETARELINRKKGIASDEIKIGCIMASYQETYTDPFYGKVLRGIQKSAADNGCRVEYICALEDTSSEEIINSILNQKDVDGIIAMGRFSEKIFRDLKKIKNIIYVGLNHINRQFDEVICDSYECAYEAVKYLISLGNRKIGYIGIVPYKEESQIVNEHRFNGYAKALFDYNLELDHSIIRNCKLSLNSSYEAALSLVSEKQLPTALFCANDICALGAIRAITEKSLRVPEDIAVIGIDNIEMAEYSKPLLTTIDINKRELGEWGVKILLDKIKTKRKTQVRVTMQFQMIVRESCGTYVKRRILQKGEESKK